MRYYSNDYRTRLTDQINRANNSVDEVNYVSAVTDFRDSLGSEDPSVEECSRAAWSADSSVYKAKNKLTQLCTELNRFYGSVDKAADSVITTAKTIDSIISEANRILQNLDEALNSTGKYEGRPVTVRSINDAGATWIFEDAKRLAWDNIVCNLSKDGSPNPDIITFFLKRVINKLNAGQCVTSGERAYINSFVKLIKERIDNGNISTRVRYLPALNELYKYFRLNRYDSYDDAGSMPETTLQDCITVYELLNPTAAQIMNKFFEPAWLEIEYDDSILASNIQIIKYDLYTAEARERRLVFAFLPYMKLRTLTYNDTAAYDPDQGRLELNLGKDCRTEVMGFDCSFFHEFGHGLDDLLFDDQEEEVTERILKYASYNYYSDVINDFYKDLDDAIDKLGIKLSANERSDLYMLLESKDNVNVSYPDDDQYYKKLISGNKKVKQAYNSLRNYFGYRDYIVDETNSSFTVERHSGFIGSYDTTTVAGDLFGAFTNLKLGAVDGSHSLNPGSPTEPEIESAKDLKKYLSNNSYWNKVGRFTTRKILPFVKISDTDGEAMCSEFFADSFEDRIRGIDQKLNKELFPSAINDFENTLDETLADVYGDPQ